MATHRKRAAPRRGRRIVCDPAVLGGKPVVEGTRMSVGQILGLLARGMSPARITESYPILTAADVRAAVSFAQQAVRDEVVLDVSR